MKQDPVRSTGAIVGAFTITLGWGLSAVAADIPADLRIDRVVVYRAGATVTREGSVQLPAGTHRLIIKGLRADIAAKALHVDIQSPVARLGAIELSQINEGRFVSDAERELRLKLDDKGDQRVVIQDEIATAQTQLKLLDSLASAPSGGTNKPAVDGANLPAVLATISTGSSAARKRIRDANVALRNLDKEIEKLKADLGKVATQSKQSTEVRASFESSAPAPALVTVSYIVEDARWNWIYEARLDTGKHHMALERQGQVQQRTGEDWKNVTLTLSNAAPAEDASTPTLNSIFADLEDPTPKQPLPSLKSTAGLQEIVVTSRKVEASISATDYLAEYKIPGQATLLADSEPRIYPVAQNSFDVTLVERVVPSANRGAYLEAVFKYQRDIPIERAHLQLYRDGAFVGEAETSSFLPGADVRIPFGIDDRVRVAIRQEPEQSGQRGLFNKQIVKENRLRFEITSYHSAPISVEVIDSVPVPRNSDIHVEELQGTTEPTTKALDGKAGVWLWKFDAQPKQTVAISNFYSIRYPKDKELEMEEDENENEAE